MHSSTALVAVAVAATALLLLQRQRGLLPLHHRPLRPFGACVEASLPSLIRNGALLRRLWRQNGGLLVLRGLSLTPRGMLELSALFGEVEQELDDSKIDFRVGGLSSVMRIGNVRDETGRLISMHTISAPLPPERQYRAAERQPAWHTDSLYRRRPPVGSALYCVTAPPSGGATCFADATTAFASLDEVTKERLRGLTCVCSMAHHDAKVKKRGSPDYPTLSEAQRRANPAQRVPLVLRHPQTGREALSGMNAGTCAVLPRGGAFARGDGPVRARGGRDAVGRGGASCAAALCDARRVCGPVAVGAGRLCRVGQPMHDALRNGLRVATVYARNVADDAGEGVGRVALAVKIVCFER